LKIIVLDACAVIAFLRAEPGFRTIRKLLSDEQNTCFLHAVNLCEVYYDFIKAEGLDVAENAMHDLNSLPVGIRSDLDDSIWRTAGKLKAVLRISLADCFAIALAQKVSGELITSDRKELAPLCDEGIFAIRFFR